MFRTPVVSSHIRSVGYDKSSQVLEVEFCTGGLYHYYSVPQYVYDALMLAPSHGKYLHGNIKGVYLYQKIK